MSGFKAIGYIEKRKAGMYILCNLIAKKLEKSSKNNATWKDRTGNARQGIKGISTSSKTCRVFTISLSHSVDYGSILEEGSEPHVIRPKNKKALYWKGAAHPVKEIHHPGTKGTHELENTINNNTSVIKTALINYWGG
ncbi:hypothetical protein G8V05_05165 [Clostridium botulinum C/D]|uniref:hypothetical protein n=2 Tax=Clostridium botulinum TaxID=1491 RepID=UPI0004D72E50|nr:hypothetical protein [Clostridium botulinum]KEH96175.1 hypothetical protein Z953_p0242 [Clostridium botulinum D str. 16868]MCD3202802.1 hypothetical protein [Clostridium botulinum C/D]MCD3230826.1 hypothetical protein [Clostridium botulinum C/D]MCD3279415.1 hypothetical protein [Clostridium botulinum C/D]MCD3281606.1 hypothetical protein [Clostridium botulinum C/D]